MSTHKKKGGFKPWTLIIPVFILLFIIIYLDKESYLSCVSQISTCLSSKKYVSIERFSFRYPQDYPITYRKGEEMIREYNFNDKYAEWVNFSRTFYPNAGGDRLGSIIVEKNSPYKTIEEYGSKIISDYNNLSEKLKETPPEIVYITVGGEKAIRINTTQQPSSFNPPNDRYVVLHDGDLYNINFDYNNYYHKLPIEYYQQGKELILSTFRFK